MFSSKVREKLKHYVYLYIDPRANRPFYVGKGIKNRCFSHLKDTSESAKAIAIAELTKLGLKPRIEILKYGLTEDEALLVEAAAIDLLGIESLTNKVHGHGSRHGSRTKTYADPEFDPASSLVHAPINAVSPVCAKATTVPN